MSDRQIITRQATGEKPVLQTPEQHRFLTILTNGIEESPGGKCFVCKELAPTGEQRRLLLARRADLRSSIVAKEPTRESGAVLLKRIMDMFDAWPTVRMDEEKAMGVARTYATLIEKLPLWAIDAGILECQGRKTPFPPSAGELRSACAGKLAPAQDEIKALSRVLDAEIYVPDPSRAAEAIARVKDVADSFKRRCGGDVPLKARDYKEHPDAEAERQLEEFDVRRGVGPVDHAKPVSASPSLLAAIRRG